MRKSTTGLRTWRGTRYVARDRTRRALGSPALQPEHACWNGKRVYWVRHPEGGQMQMFTGPEWVFADLIRGATVIG